MSHTRATREARHRAHERSLLDLGVVACAAGAMLAASLGALAAAAGLLPFDIFSAAVLTGLLGGVAGVLIATWRALFLETPGDPPPDRTPEPHTKRRPDRIATSHSGADYRTRR